MTPVRGIFDIIPAEYVPHVLHAPDRLFRETNCYVDVWIEVLHTLGLDPTACLAFTLAADFEGDQWTFFKPPHTDLALLYGVGIEELSLWRPLLEHLQSQVARGRLPLCEVDSYFLPDTIGSDYRQQHTKTTIAIAQLDSGAQHLRYFHNAGYFELSGDDFSGLLRPEAAQRADYLPPYCEIIKPERARALEPTALRAASRELLRGHLTRRPARNPLQAYTAQVAEHVALIVAGGSPTYHAYSFALVRQLGACHELAAAYLRWLDPSANGALTQAAQSFTQLAEGAKMLIMKLARVANSGRAPDLTGLLSEMEHAWAEGMAHVDRALSVRT